MNRLGSSGPVAQQHPEIAISIIRLAFRDVLAAVFALAITGKLQNVEIEKFENVKDPRPGALPANPATVFLLHT
jgi:hypothetical protein